MKLKDGRVAVVRLRIQVEVPITAAEEAKMYSDRGDPAGVEKPVVEALMTKLGFVIREIAVYEDPYADITLSRRNRIERVRVWQERRREKAAREWDRCLREEFGVQS